MILNGSGKEEGGWTYIEERGASVIDYVVTNNIATEEIEKVEEGLRTESDHVPMEVTIKGKEKEYKEKEMKIEVERSVWTEEGIEQYHKRCEGWICTKEEQRDMERTRKKVKNSVEKIKKRITQWRIGRREWHSKEWKVNKRELKKEPKELKKGKIDRETYVGRRKEYREWCDKERKRHEKEKEETIRAIRTEEEAWKYKV